MKQRMHLDIEAGSVQQVLDLGAMVLEAETFPWAELSDPEGGELCVFVRKRLDRPRLYEVVVDTPEPPSCGARTGRSTGRCWPTRTGTSSARSLQSEPLGQPVRRARAWAYADAVAIATETTSTDGHAPSFLASGCEPPIAATYAATRAVAVAGPEVRPHSRPHQAPAAANSRPPSSRRWL